MNYFPQFPLLSLSSSTQFNSIMSWRNRSSTNRNHQELDLKLNLSSSPPARRPPARPVESPEVSPERSCVSSDESLKYSSSPESSSMVVVGCPRCLMYVMLSSADHRCPKCKSTVLLDFHRQNDVVINEKPRRRN